VKPNSQLTLTASALLYVAIFCTAGDPIPVSARPAVLLPAPAPESVLALPDCEQDVLGLLGWQQMYDPAGYTIHAVLPLNCSTETSGSGLSQVSGKLDLDRPVARLTRLLGGQRELPGFADHELQQQLCCRVIA